MADLDQEITAPVKPARAPIEGRRYMVWCEDGGVPTVAHRSWAVAKTEAKRLARLHRGFRFHVMSTSAIIQKDPLPAAPVTQ